MTTKEEKEKEKEEKKKEKKMAAMKRDAIIAYGKDVIVEQSAEDGYVARDKNGTIVGVGMFDTWGEPVWTDIIND